MSEYPTNTKPEHLRRGNLRLPFLLAKQRLHAVQLAVVPLSVQRSRRCPRRGCSWVLWTRRPNTWRLFPLSLQEDLGLLRHYWCTESRFRLIDVRIPNLVD